MEGFVFFLFWMLLAAGVGALAHSRGRSGPGFFLLALVFSPVLGLIVVLVISDLNRAMQEDLERRREVDLRETRDKREHERQIEALKVLSGRVAGHQQEPAQVSQEGLSVASELERLVQLRDRGVLTDDEFNEQKRVLLGRTRNS